MDNMRVKLTHSDTVISTAPRNEPEHNSLLHLWYELVVKVYVFELNIIQSPHDDSENKTKKTKAWIIQ